MVETDLAERFLSAPMLAGVEPGSRRAILEILVEERAEQGSVLLVQGQPNDHLSFLVSGTATIERPKAAGDGGASPRGRRAETLATLAAPSVFGTTSFFRPDPPTFTVRAASDVLLLTLYHPAHDRLRADNPRAAEALAVSALNVLTDRLDELDALFSKYMADHPDDRHKVTEWAGFRARLFEEPND